MLDVEQSTPLSFESLLLALHFGAGGDPHKVHLASSQLQSWQTLPEYHKYLQKVIGDREISIEARWLAAIQLKNGIDRFWRKTARNAIDQDEKVEIRSKCLEIGISESDRRLALQNALFVAKIVRIDYPHDWPDAITKLLDLVRAAQEPDVPDVQLPASLLMLLTVVKELSTARLMKTRRCFYGDAPNILSVLGLIYLRLFSTWSTFIESGGLDEQNSVRHMENSLICLRILRRILVSAYETPGRDENVRNMWGELSRHFEWLIGLDRNKLCALAPQKGLILEKLLMQFAKLHVSMVESHPYSFTSLPNALHIAAAHWGLLKNFGTLFSAESDSEAHSSLGQGLSENETSFEESVALKGLQLLRGCIKSLYNPTPTFKLQDQTDKEERFTSRQIIKEQLLSEDLVRQMMEIIVTKFFVFRQSDLRRWADEPEDFERQEEGEGDAWKYSIRTCAEKLFLDLIINNKDFLADPLIRVFHEVADPNNKDVLLKDSIYSAIGLSAPVILGKLDFNSFMTSVLLPELQIQDRNYSILRRRASIMVAQWTAVGGLDTPTVYEIFAFLLDASQELNDVVVRITAGRQLKHAIDPYEMPAAKLMPFAKVLLTSVMGLVESVDTIETKIALLGTIQTLIQLMDDAVAPFANDVISPLPRIWEAAEEEFLLKQNIIGVLSDLFKAVKGESARFHHLTLPLISNALDKANEARVFLLDDTVDLWVSLLAQAPHSTPQILSLWPNLFPLFETADENLRRALEILDSYILLSPQTIVQEAMTETWRNLSGLMSQQLRRDARVSVCELAEGFLTAANLVGGKETFLETVSVATESGFLLNILGGLWDAYKTHQDQSPKATRSEVNGIIETRYWLVFARILLVDADTAVKLLQKFTTVSNLPGLDRTIDGLLTEIFSHHDNLSNPVASKLVALALASLANLGRPEVDVLVGRRLQEFIVLWTATIHECTYEGKDTLLWNSEQATDSFESESPEQARRRRLEAVDPVRCQNIRDVVALTLKNVAQRLGDTFNELVGNVDKDVMRHFESLELFADI